MRHLFAYVAVCLAIMPIFAMPLGVRLAMCGDDEGNGASELLPELGRSPSKEVIAAALSGSADVRIAENVSDAESYAEFREWVEDIQGAEGSAAGFAAVLSSPYAWLSYALDVDSLIAAAPKEGDLKIDGFGSSAADGVFELTTSIEGVEVGDDALEANLKKVFAIEGASAIMRPDGTEDGFSADSVEMSDAEPLGGKVKFTVAPKGGGAMGTSRPTRFFFRVKMK